MEYSTMERHIHFYLFAAFNTLTGIEPETSCTQEWIITQTKWFIDYIAVDIDLWMWSDTIMSKFKILSWFQGHKGGFGLKSKKSHSVMDLPGALGLAFYEGSYLTAMEKKENEEKVSTMYL